MYTTFNPNIWTGMSAQTSKQDLQSLQARLSGSVGCTSDCWSGGRGFDLHRVRQHSFIEIDYEIFSAVILSLLGVVRCGKGVVCLIHRGVQLILAYSWARPAILVADKGRGGMLLFLLFLHFRSCSFFFLDPLFHLLCYLFYLFSPFLW